MSPDTTRLFSEAITLHRAGELPRAEAMYREVLRFDPAHSDALQMLGVLAAQRGEHRVALDLLTHAIRINPRYSGYHYNLAKVHETMGNASAAEAGYREALRLAPDDLDSLLNLSGLMLRRGRPDEGERLARAALAIQPDSLGGLNNLGLALCAAGFHEEAVRVLSEAQRRYPASADTLVNLARAYISGRRPRQAMAALERALQLNPRLAEAHAALGNLFKEARRPAEAEAAYARAARLAPLAPDILMNLGNLLFDQKRLPEAEAAYRRVLELGGDEGEALDKWLLVRRHQCRWDEMGLPRPQGDHSRVFSPDALTPFVTLCLGDDPAVHLAAARRHAQRKHPPESRPLWRGEAYRHERLRLAYLSADFHDHATAYLITELIETHDRARFEVHGFSWGPGQAGGMQGRLKQAFDHFTDVAGWTDAAVARRLRELEIDIAIDLKGYTKYSRPGIFAWRPAPVQVNYLGYPGTMGTADMDYLIADPVLIPAPERAHYSERVVFLPDCYQPNDGKREISPDTPSRAECGLPEAGFVFCSFNNNYKLTPEVFAIWMNLLRQVPDSVLWLLESNPWAKENLRKAAGLAGVAPERLVFAPKLPLPEHLARHRCADLFLDTWPVCAHTTASDALWAGLPVLTLPGRGFASRVAASLLRAVGLEELVCGDAADYEAMALRLAREPAALADLKVRLARNRLIFPLFNGQRYRRHLEAAFLAMRPGAPAGPAGDVVIVGD